ncbi:MAG: rhodanese-like domain-containing protein [Nocardioidaceae bacterium]
MPDIDVTALDEELAAGASLVDVREPAEFARAHVPGARLIPMSSLPARLNELDRSRPVYVICATGNRSGAMCNVLAAAGFDAVNVAGGTVAWIRSGRPVETGVQNRQDGGSSRLT